MDLERPLLAYNRPVELDAFKVYRSLNNSTGFQEIAEVEETLLHISMKMLLTALPITIMLPQSILTVRVRTNWHGFSDAC